ncbi:MAG: ribonuclease HII [Bacteriovoracaceae bacterium]
MLELKFIPVFPCEIIATDEVGRGPLGGPVVIGAVRLLINSSDELRAVLKFLRTKGIKDSKLLSEDDRKIALTKLGVEGLPFRKKGGLLLKGVAIHYVTWEMDHTVIDEENILGASLRGMKEASQFLSDPQNLPTNVFIDGHMKLRWGNEKSSWSEFPVVKGDSKSALIGLASVIAKVKRDGHMKEMHALYPQYGFDSHYGYPTPAHRKAIKNYGPSPIHRKSFKGVREYVGAGA